MRISKPPEERRAELLAAARTLFDRNGTENTRISDIVQTVGVSQGIFYYYFRSKQEIVEAVVKQVVQELRQRLEEIFAAELTLYEKLARFISVYIDVVDQFTGDDELRVAAKEDELIYQKLMVEEGQNILAGAMARLLRQGVEEGVISIAYPAKTATVLLYGLRAYSMHQLPSRRMIFTIVEQSLHLPHGKLVRLCGKEKKGNTKNRKGGEAG
ncbi:MAG: TetR/AcrR family transcriptional regulator [Oscillospiraceae bacterium]